MSIVWKLIHTAYGKPLKIIVSQSLEFSHINSFNSHQAMWFHNLPCQVQLNQWKFTEIWIIAELLLTLIFKQRKLSCGLSFYKDVEQILLIMFPEKIILLLQVKKMFIVIHQNLSQTEWLFKHKILRIS